MGGGTAPSGSRTARPRRAGGPRSRARRWPRSAADRGQPAREARSRALGVGDGEHDHPQRTCAEAGWRREGRCVDLAARAALRAFEQPELHAERRGRVRGFPRAVPGRRETVATEPRQGAGHALDGEREVVPAAARLLEEGAQRAPPRDGLEELELAVVEGQAGAAVARVRSSALARLGRREREQRRAGAGAVLEVRHDEADALDPPGGDGWAGHGAFRLLGHASGPAGTHGGWPCSCVSTAS